MQFFCKFAIFLQFFNIYVCLDIHSFVQFSKNHAPKNQFEIRPAQCIKIFFLFRACMIIV